MGMTTKRQSNGSTTENAKLTSIGLAMAVVVAETRAFPRSEIICTNTSPNTSSNTAAPVRTMPRRVVIRPLVFRTVNVVPRLVEQSAAPALKDPRGVASARGCKKNENAMGRHVPVKATKVDRSKFALKLEKGVDRPPTTVSL